MGMPEKQDHWGDVLEADHHTSSHSDVCKLASSMSELLYHMLSVPYSVAIHSPRGS